MIIYTSGNKWGTNFKYGWFKIELKQEYFELLSKGLAYIKDNSFYKKTEEDVKEDPSKETEKAKQELFVSEVISRIKTDKEFGENLQQTGNSIYIVPIWEFWASKGLLKRAVYPDVSKFLEKQGFDMTFLDEK